MAFFTSQVSLTQRKMYDIEKLRTLLINEEYWTVDENGRCFPPSNEIYERISNAVDGNPSTKHVYTIVKNNKNGLYETIVNAFEVKNMSLEENADNFDPNTSTTTCKDQFDVFLTFEEWKHIKPIKTTYEDGRNYVILQPG